MFKVMKILINPHSSSLIIISPIPNHIRHPRPIVHRKISSPAPWKIGNRWLLQMTWISDAQPQKWPKQMVMFEFTVFTNHENPGDITLVHLISWFYRFIPMSLSI
jgi:hypothetical protein